MATVGLESTLKRKFNDMQVSARGGQFKSARPRPNLVFSYRPSVLGSRKIPRKRQSEVAPAISRDFCPDCVRLCFAFTSRNSAMGKQINITGWVGRILLFIVVLFLVCACLDSVDRYFTVYPTPENQSAFFKTYDPDPVLRPASSANHVSDWGEAKEGEAGRRAGTPPRSNASSTRSSRWRGWIDTSS